MNAQREISHLLRIAHDTQKRTAAISASQDVSSEMLATINGYIQGLQRAAGEIARLAGASPEEVERLDAAIYREVFAQPA